MYIKEDFREKSKDQNSDEKVILQICSQQIGTKQQTLATVGNNLFY